MSCQSVIDEYKKTGKPEWVTKDEVGSIMKALQMPWGEAEEKELEKTVEIKDGKLNFIDFIKACFGEGKPALLISDKAETEIGKKRLAAKHRALEEAVKQGKISEDMPLTLFIDEDDARASVKRLMAAFPPSEGFYHCFAVKANPTLEYLKILGAEGMGFESASMGELTNALRAFGVADECFPAEFGFPNAGTKDFPKWFERNPAQGLVIDSPIKTRKEIAFCLKNGIPINVDNFDELGRIEDWMKANESSRPDTSLHPLYGRVGIRINPQVGGGANAQLSTGVATSKFGVGLNDDRQKVVDAYLKHPWLNMVHGHVGSQGIPLELMMAGIRALVELIREVNAQAPGRIDTLDMGGGLTVNFGAEDVIPSYQDLADRIKADVPGIFGADKVVPTIMTEMGRTLSAKSGWLGSRIEYTKYAGGLRIMAQHAGVDICVRTIYHPDHWPLRITCYGADGTFIPFQPDGDDVEPTNVSGPCCIAGDVIAWRRPLPKQLKEGDILMVHDVGGYYHSSYSKYNSRQSPPLLGYTISSDDKVTFRTLQKQETVADTLAYFSV